MIDFKHEIEVGTPKEGDWVLDFNLKPKLLQYIEPVDDAYNLYGYQPQINPALFSFYNSFSDGIRSNYGGGSLIFSVLECDFHHLYICSNELAKRLNLFFLYKNKYGAFEKTIRHSLDDRQINDFITYLRMNIETSLALIEDYYNGTPTRLLERFLFNIRIKDIVKVKNKKALRQITFLNDDVWICQRHALNKKERRMKIKANLKNKQDELRPKSLWKMSHYNLINKL